MKYSTAHRHFFGENLKTNKTAISRKLGNNIKRSLIITISILASLPYSSSLSLPNGDPAPGRSPGPPNILPINDQNDIIPIITGINDDEHVDIQQNSDEINPTDTIYDDSTASDVVTEVTTDGGIDNDSEKFVVGDACDYARTPSDSDNVITLANNESDVNFSVSHTVFDTEYLVKGVVYEGKIFIILW